MNQPSIYEQQPENGQNATRIAILAPRAAFGAFVNMGSTIAAEILANSGFAWLVLDLEHGAGDEPVALGQIQAAASTGIATIVRVESLSRPRIHRALDMGAHGVLVPQIRDAEEAWHAAAFCRYAGARGVARGVRAWKWSGATRADFDGADADVVCAVQIETSTALAGVDAIAAVNGVDILFVGPADLAYGLEIDGSPTHPEVVAAAATVAAAAKEHGKTSGILVEDVDQAALYLSQGFTFIGCSSDGAMLRKAARRLVDQLAALTSSESARDTRLPANDVTHSEPGRVPGA